LFDQDLGIDGTGVHQLQLGCASINSSLGHSRAGAGIHEER
jgi:hypothetical protein